MSVKFAPVHNLFFSAAVYAAQEAAGSDAWYSGIQVLSWTPTGEEYNWIFLRVATLSNFKLYEGQLERKGYKWNTFISQQLNFLKKILIS